MIAMHEAVPLAIEAVRGASWNANKVTKPTLDRIRRSLDQFGAVENLIVRPSWCIGARTEDDLPEARTAQALSMDEPWYECLSGNHRLSIYREGGIQTVRAVIVELCDPKAKMLAQAMNRIGGKDDPDKLKDLLLDVLKVETPADVTKLLPHSERDLLKLLNGEDDDTAPDIPEGPADSVVGTIYELGPHRVLCGDSCDAAAVTDLLAGATPTLMVTDPPYGVSLNQGWRDDVLGGDDRRAAGTAQDDTITGDDGFAWVPAIGLPGCDVAYVWHADKFFREAADSLEQNGFVIRQQIIWRKRAAAIGRAAYHWQHEPCWYAVRKGATANWLGGRKQVTVWDAGSPKQFIGRSTGDDASDGKEDHPTQKPISIFETPIVNHLAVGEVVYDPFLGSGTCLIAAAKNDRVCYGVELMPKYVDVIRRRWTRWAIDSGRDPGPGALS